MSKAWNASQLPNITQSFIGFKNKIINGDFSVWQRGLNFSITNSSSIYHADRWYSSIWKHSSGKLNAKPDNTVPSGNVGINLIANNDDNDNALNLDESNLSEATGIMTLRYIFEGYHLYNEIKNGDYITISFWFKSNVAGTFSVALRRVYGADDSGNDIGYSYVTDFEYDGSETWKKISKTINFDSSLLQQYNHRDEQIGIELHIASYFPSHMANTTDKWVDRTDGVHNTKFVPICSKNATKWYTTAGNHISVADVQLEKGTIATDFEQVPFDVQLHRCRRYFFNTMYPHFRYDWLDGALTTSAISTVNFTERSYYLKNKMRTTPSITVYAFETGTVGKYRDRTDGVDAGTPTIGPETNTGERVYFYDHQGGLTNEHLYTWHFTADAEM